MKDIAIFGAGGFGKEVACLIRTINKNNPQWNLVGFYDDGIEIGTPVSHFGNVLGGVEQLNEHKGQIAVAMAIGNAITIEKILCKITKEDVEYPNLIHPDFDVTDPETFHIGKGNIIQRHCTATCDTEIGDFNIFNGTVCMGHDVKIGSFNTFMPLVRVSGEVIIGDENFFGIASIILQQIKVGSGIRLGAASVLMTKPKTGYLYIGNPARKTEL